MVNDDAEPPPRQRVSRARATPPTATRTTSSQKLTKEQFTNVKEGSSLGRVRHRRRHPLLEVRCDRQVDEPLSRVAPWGKIAEPAPSRTVAGSARFERSRRCPGAGEGADSTARGDPAEPALHGDKALRGGRALRRTATLNLRAILARGASALRAPPVSPRSDPQGEHECLKHKPLKSKEIRRTTSSAPTSMPTRPTRCRARGRGRRS